jgi:transcriptional regulator with XRE-family HTH domain
MTLTEAVRELRRLSGLNQQFFATELKMSTRALSQYESGKTPEPKQLLAFYARAYKQGRADLCQIFAETLSKEMEAPPGFWVVLRYGPGAPPPDAWPARGKKPGKKES